MDVIVNGETRTVPEGSTLAELLTRLEQKADAVATAVNGGLVTRAQRGDCLLQPNDHITCFQPIVGG
jgi:sulfur carrier protein